MTNKNTSVLRLADVSNYVYRHTNDQGQTGLNVLNENYAQWSFN